MAPDGSVGGWLSLDDAVPEDCTLRQFRNQLLIRLRSEWRGFKPGTLLAARMDELAWDLEGGPGGRAPPGAGGREPTLTPLFEPTERVALRGLTLTRTKAVCTLLDEVRTRVLSLSCSDDGAWACDESDGREPFIGGLSIGAVDADEGDDVWLTRWSHLQPHALSIGSVSAGVRGLDGARPLRSLPAQFDASTLEVSQEFATSKDGTRVPFFIVRPKAAAPAAPPGPSAPAAEAQPVPTLLYGYGGFEISLTPNYMSTVGAAWLERGGCFVEANIRGGGEFGPAWHRAALREKRHKAYEDFEAVAARLVELGVTTREQLACRGGSNGGLLVGVRARARAHLATAVARRATGGIAAPTAGTAHARISRGARRAAAQATCWYAALSSGVRSCAPCRSSTCAASTSCSRVRRGWPSMATQTRPTGRTSCETSRRTTTSTRAGSTRRCS